MVVNISSLLMILLILKNLMILIYLIIAFFFSSFIPYFKDHFTVTGLAITSFSFIVQFV